MSSITYEGNAEYGRLDKRVARRLHGDGATIYMAPKNMCLDSPWIQPIPMRKDADFDKQVDEFMYYNHLISRGVWFYEKRIESSNN